MRNHPAFTAYLALILVCFFWGTTYFGFLIALEGFGPVSLVAIRNLISGGLLLTWAAVTRRQFPRGRDLWLTGLFGLITIGAGNLGLATAEQWVPSGLASLFVTTGPFWNVGIEAMLPGGPKLHAPTMRGLAVGLAGVLLLVAPAAVSLWNQPSLATGGGVVLGFLVIQLGDACWGLGSVLQRNRKIATHPFVIAGVQQVAVGIVLSMLAPLEPRAMEPTARSIAAILYLAIFGGIVGYGCYMTALTRLPLAIVSIYIYVNPAVAVLLGWAFLNEHFGWLEFSAMLIIFLGVYLVRRAARVPKSQPT